VGLRELGAVPRQLRKRLVVVHPFNLYFLPKSKLVGLGGKVGPVVDAHDAANLGVGDVLVSHLPFPVAVLFDHLRRETGGLHEVLKVLSPGFVDLP